MFQSTPASNGGRISAVCPAPVRERCFNPRPPAMAGESPAQSSPRCDGHVSIHARQQWRANRRRRRRWLILAWFQSTPASNGGRIASGVGLKHQFTVGFNPRPPAMAGESAPAPAWQPATGCFNPRPPAMAGESWYALAYSTEHSVSIHARQQWRANPSDNEVLDVLVQVSIHARQQWRANPSAALSAESCTCLFQSTPASNGGRIDDVHRGLQHGVDVSIHARQQWRANQDHPPQGL